MLHLDRSAFEHFDEQGYVLIEGLLDVELDIEPIVAEYEGLLDELAETWKAEGRVTSTYSELPFCERLQRLVIEGEPTYDQHFDISLPQADITDETPIHHGPAVLDLLRSPRLLDAVEQFIGPEIFSNPVQHTRIKLPESQLPDASRTGLTAQVSWHQDLGVVTTDADNVEMLTVWLPIVPATEENGCLAVVPGSHRKELALHCRSANPLTLNQVCIPDRMVSDATVPLPMQPGDVLFMHRKTIHRGLINNSDVIRWSFDLRYQPIGQSTGRPWFPGFVARSRAEPESELTDASRWAELWREARSRLAAGGDVAFNRWQQGDPRCA